MTTISDVAQAAGVSRSTVSHALSGKRPISEATRRRIAQAIADLGYTPSARGLALATSRSWAIGLSVPGLYTDFAAGTMPYVLAITKRARELGYDVLMVTDDDPDEGIRRVMVSDRVDGVICMAVTREDPRIAALARTKRPGVILGSPANDQGVDVVDIDFQKAATMLVDHLADQGHRQIVLLTMPKRYFDQGMGYTVVFRDTAVERAHALGLTMHCVEADSYAVDDTDKIAYTLNHFPDATALLVQNDAMLLDIQSLLKAKELRVPEDIAVVGIFSSMLRRLASLPYTEVETSPDLVSTTSVDMLVQRIEHPTSPHVHRLVDPLLIERGTGAYPSARGAPPGR